MLALTPSALERFLRDSGFESRSTNVKSSDGWSVRVRKADDDLVSRFLSDRVAEAFSEDGGQVLLEVSDWSIFPSWDNRKIFLGYRRLLGASIPLIEARAHLFERDEVEDFRNLFNLGLMFLYDMQITNLKSGFSVRVDHHDFVEFKLSSVWQEAFENFFDGDDVHWPSSD